jgi:hypothetical protein
VARFLEGVDDGVENAEGDEGPDPRVESGPDEPDLPADVSPEDLPDDVRDRVPGAVLERLED